MSPGPNKSFEARGSLEQISDITVDYIHRYSTVDYIHVYYSSSLVISYGPGYRVQKGI